MFPKTCSAVRGAKRGSKGPLFPGRRITTGRRIAAGPGSPTSPNMVTSTFFNTVFPYERLYSSFEHGGTVADPGSRV